MRAADTREGMVVDMTYVAAEYGDVMAQDLATYEYAAVEADAEPAPESPDAPGVPAVLIFMEHTQVTATVDNGIGDTVTVELGTVPTWSLPLTADWKRTYRPVALEMAASKIPLPGRGVTVRFHA